MIFANAPVPLQFSESFVGRMHGLSLLQEIAAVVLDDKDTNPDITIRLNMHILTLDVRAKLQPTQVAQLIEPLSTLEP
jgi:hypothetical protein